MCPLGLVKGFSASSSDQSGRTARRHKGAQERVRWAEMVRRRESAESRCDGCRRRRQHDLYDAGEDSEQPLGSQHERRADECGDDVCSEHRQPRKKRRRRGMRMHGECHGGVRCQLAGAESRNERQRSAGQNGKRSGDRSDGRTHRYQQGQRRCRRYVAAGQAVRCDGKSGRHSPDSTTPKECCRGRVGGHSSRSSGRRGVRADQPLRRRVRRK